MKAYEFPIKVNAEGKLDIPSAITEILPSGQVVRMIILIREPEEDNEQAAWSDLAAEQFLAGYSEADAIYDNKGKRS